ncbi:MAG TPA: DUF1549 domain-containing protein, partial [Gemmataceae bacterium]|nr:DUF1549 domain-containing protein [Gemmataceae bacterium]
MWKRNLLFAGVIVAGLIALTAGLLPRRTPARARHFDPAEAQSDDFRAAVARVDAALYPRWTESQQVQIGGALAGAPQGPLHALPWLNVPAEPALPLAPPAADLVVARRLALALTGTIPSLQDIRQFEAQPPGQRLDWYLAVLLEDRRFGDYLAERLARAYVGTEAGPFIVFRRRRLVTWLSDQVMANRPYDELARELMTAQGLWTDRPATNFITATVDQANQKGPDPERLAARTARAFLGLRLDCAQCHDHFLEPAWKQTDFQSLAAFFGQTRQVVTHVSDGGGEYSYKDRVSGGSHEIAPAVPFLPELLPADGTRRERLARWLTDPANVYFARAMVNRVWAMLFDRPLLKRVEAQSLEEPIPPSLEILAKDFAAHGHDLRRLILLIASTEVFRLDSAAPHEITEAHERAWAAFPVTRLRPEQVIGAVIQSASVRTINQSSHVFVRLARYFNERDFVKRYGDADDEEFGGGGGTVPQRLLMMNGELVNG